MNTPGSAPAKRRALAAAASMGMLGAICWLLFSSQPREPVYQGKPLQAWLRDFDHPHDSTNYAMARAAILQMGTNVLPHLERYLRWQDWRYHRQWINLRSKLHLLRAPVDYASFWHQRAAKACGQFAEAGAPAFPAMMEAAQDRWAASDVTVSLSWMLPASTPVLTNLLASTNPITRNRAVDALATAPSHPQVALMARTALLNALRDPDPGLRVTAASALGVSVGVSAEHRDAVIAALSTALEDPHPIVRGNAATSLGNYGTNAKPALPGLLKLLKDTNSYPFQRSILVLRKIDPEAAAKAGVPRLPRID